MSELSLATAATAVAAASHGSSRCEHKIAERVLKDFRYRLRLVGHGDQVLVNEETSKRTIACGVHPGRIHHRSSHRPVGPFQAVDMITADQEAGYAHGWEIRAGASCGSNTAVMWLMLG